MVAVTKLGYGPRLLFVRKLAVCAFVGLILVLRLIWDRTLNTSDPPLAEISLLESYYLDHA